MIYYTPHNLENLKKRLETLKEKIATEGIILTDQQLTALEREKTRWRASGEIETAHPDYLGYQDSFYVGNLKEYIEPVKKIVY